MQGIAPCISTLVWSSSQSAAFQRSSKRTVDGDGVVLPGWGVWLNEIAKYVASTGNKEEKNESANTLLNTFSTHKVEVLTDLGKEKLQDQEFALLFRIADRSVPRTGVLAGGYNLYLKD